MTAQFDGTSSQIPGLTYLAELINMPVINLMVWMLAGVLAITAFASWYARGTLKSVHPLFLFFYAGVVGALASLNLTARGGDNDWPHLAVLGLIVTMFVAINTTHLMLSAFNWHYRAEAHPASPLLFGVNFLALAVWTTLSVTLLQNSMGARWPEQMYWLHIAVVLAVCVLIISIVAQIAYSRGRKSYGIPTLMRKPATAKEPDTDEANEAAEDQPAATQPVG